MKIEIEVEDLSAYLDAYNHAYNVFNNGVRGSVFFGLEEDNVSLELLEALKKKAIKLYGKDTNTTLLNVVESELQQLKDVYDQLIKIEKEKLNE